MVMFHNGQLTADSAVFGEELISWNLIYFNHVLWSRVVGRFLPVGWLE